MQKAIALSRAAIALLPTSVSAPALATVMPSDSLHWNASPHPLARGFRRAAKSLLASAIFAEPSLSQRRLSAAPESPTESSAGVSVKYSGDMPLFSSVVKALSVGRY